MFSPRHDPGGTKQEGSDTGAIRVFIIDDSSVVRAIFSRLVGDAPGLELAGTAGSAEEALSQFPNQPIDVVLLDLEMPGMGGMRALPEIIRSSGKARVMVVSSLTGEGAEHTVQALALGAADALLKPGAGGFDRDYRDRLVERIQSLGGRSLRRAVASAETARPPLVRRTASPVRPAVLAIGASTGGIHATGQLLAALPAVIGIPIIITQHLPAEFSQPYARQLHELCGREVQIAATGQILRNDCIHLAPGDAHVTVQRRSEQVVIQLDRHPAESGCMPSVDSMFASLAAIYGAKVLGIVLTGMGRDGTEGARKLVEVGGEVLVQNEASSAVWGMPGSIARAGLAAAELHPRDIALRVAASLGRR
ncbi:chemotaxis-specific protein-glutamate methyltransferase CheB [Novosphingobium ginsenosidimutans]|nr:chemotaxis-specific protein-glutamate methyltransferase CheB [Novosphingobium ginsenosidimutans]